MSTHSDAPLRPTTVCGAFWWVTVLIGWPLIAYAFWQVVTTEHVVMGPALITTAAFVVLLDLLPLVQGREHNPQGVVTSIAFVFALMYVWGPWPAVVMLAISSVASDARAGKPWWKWMFNPAQYALCACAASAIIYAMNCAPTIAMPFTTFRASDLLWMLTSWVAWLLVNFVLVAGVLTGPRSFLTEFFDDFWHEVMITLGVLTISPLVMVIGIRNPVLLPLLAVPLLLLYQSGQIALDREHQAGHDALTGLPNRLTLGFELDNAFARHQREGVPFALMLIDLNDFKRVNDTLGHQVGDTLLMRLAERLQSSIRPEDTVARLGGDEFAVLAFDVDEAGALAIAQRVRDSVASAVVIDSISLDVNLSLGVAMCPEHGVDGTTLLQRADVAMYLAKELRSGVEVYSFERDDNSADQLELVGELRTALQGDGVQLHYQPKVVAADSSPIGFEALVRWNHPERGQIPPDRFIALAEKSGVMPMLTARVITLAIEQSVAWQQLGVALPIAVNVSPTDLTGDALVALIDSLLQRYRFDPSLLLLEITERVSTTQLEDALRNLDRLRARGVRISLDDFGTGYSSLARLSMLSVDEIKIDRVFVAAMADSAGGVSIVRALIDLAHARDLPVIAEGVEDHEQWRVLRSLGCDGIQGWQVARPMPAADATAWVQTRLAERPLTPVVPLDPAVGVI